MRDLLPLILVVLSSVSYAQVLDVDGDQKVGAEEALAVADQWKGQASPANAHTHLGQTWSSPNLPLIIRGGFPFRIGKTNEIVIDFLPSAPLILDNTETFEADLLLGGTGRISAVDTDSSGLFFKANGNVNVQVNADQEGTAGGFIVLDSNDEIKLIISEGSVSVLHGSLNVIGDLTYTGNLIQGMAAKDAPGGVLPKRVPAVWRGTARLDSRGEAEVEIPASTEEEAASEWTYQLTCIGGFAPVNVKEKLTGNRFQIAGGNAGMEVSWEVVEIERE